MLQAFRENVQAHGWLGKRLIVAVSGGADSMALAHLLHLCAADIIIAHCNFGLRGAESDADEQLVSGWAHAMGIPFYLRSFDTPAILQAQGGNLQETARNLRYTWLEQLRQTLQYDYIAVGHHCQDAVETLLANFFKGTGISGLHGILPLQGFIIRPLLPFKKEELLAYAAHHHIPWREDSSNKKDDYTRNRIRHHLLPAAEAIFPNVIDNLAGNILRFREAELLYQQALDRYRRKLLEQRNQDWYIPVLKLRQCRPLRTILLELLKPFGYRSEQLNDIIHLLDAPTGKRVESATHRLIRNRNFLIITARRGERSTFMLMDTDTETLPFDAHILSREMLPADSARTMTRITGTDATEIFIEAAKVTFPLILRPWKTGDYFYPFGMPKKKKKVSRLLIDRKMPLHEKEKVWVLESERKIIWVVGIRLDERFRITRPGDALLHFKIKKTGT